MRTRHLFFRLLMVPIVLLPANLFGQMELSGQFAASLRSSGGRSAYTAGTTQSTFAWQGSLFIDARVGETGMLRGTCSMDQEQNLRVERLSLAVSAIDDDHLVIEAGVVDLPFLNLGTRRYVWNNPFPGLPLMNEVHTTSLGSIGTVPYQSSMLTWNAEGPHLLDGGLYDLGVMIGGNAGGLDYGLAIVNGMAGLSGLYSPDGLNVDSDFGVVARVGWTPMTGLTVGLSGGTGSLQDDAEYADTLHGSYAHLPYRQTILGADVEYEAGYVSLYGQCVYSTFGPLENRRFGSSGYSIEGRYALTPRLSLAARAGGVFFRTVEGFVLRALGTDYEGRWDFDRTRLEGSLGYRLSREVIVRLMYQHTSFSSPSPEPESSVVMIQIASSL